MATFTISQQPSIKNLFLYPDGNSSVSFTAVGDTTNYLCVDDAWDAADESTYVKWSGISNATDIYTMQNTAIATGTINCVTLFSRARSYLYNQASTGNYKIIFDNGAGSRAYSDDFELSTGYQLLSKYYATNPITSLAWTWTNINAMFMGIECSSPSIAGAVNTIFRPNSSGSLTEFSSQYPTSGYHWDKVDEETPDDTDYVWHSTVYQDKKDSYNFQNPSLTGTINYITVYVRAWRSAAGPNYGACPLIRISTTNYYPNCYTVTTSPAYYSTTWYTNPSTSLAWTLSDLNNLEIGIRMVYTNGTGQSYPYFSQIYLVVNSNEPSVNPEIHTTQCYAQIEYVPAAETTTLDKPETYTFNNSREIKEMNFWNNDRAVYGLQRTNKTLTMNGSEWNTLTSTATSRLKTVSTMADNGDTITLSGFTDPNINTTWVIKSFNYDRDGVNLFLWNWNMTLEKA